VSSLLLAIAVIKTPLSGMTRKVGVNAAETVAQTATKGSGAYYLEFQSGKMYVGKGLETRMATSISRIETQFGDKLLKSTFYPTATTREAFILEHQMMLQTGYKPLFYDANSMLYNKIWSPGKTLLEQ
ncbi:MAG: hypothetical protein LWX70_14175, partial [Sphingobacteriia bacterium]|nr:hypothetical protein [Sphingobacteriia bacterium]